MTLPRALDSYTGVHDGLWATLLARAAEEPFNVVATGIFLLAIVHTFMAPLIQRQARRREERDLADGLPGAGVVAEVLHLLGEVEIVFGLWAAALMAVIAATYGWHSATQYVGEAVNYTEAVFVVVIMALASTRPVIGVTEAAVRQIVRLGRGSVGAWWFTILTIGPLLGSLITEPAAMTISALLLARRFYDLTPSRSFGYATLGLLFVNVSLGGALTPFAAPPILMVVAPWQWTFAHVFFEIGWRAALAVVTSTLVVYTVFRSELRSLTQRPQVPDIDVPEAVPGSAAPTALLPVPAWVVAVHVLFMAWTVVTAHYPALFVGGFLFFLGFARATAPYQSLIDLKGPLLVGFFLGGLVIHGGLQGWWIAPTLASLSEPGLYTGATLLTAMNDNALITYLATLVPNLPDSFKIAVVQGALTGGGLTVIANAPNPAGQAILSRFFPNGISPLRLLAAALTPTLIGTAIFRLL
jgi:hypothetical protein